MSARILIPLAAAAALLAGCGEQPQIVKYEAGKYQGKADTRPWEGGAYGGDKTRWQSDLRARNANQSELQRIAR